jgi:hypothetical protein
LRNVLPDRSGEFDSMANWSTMTSSCYCSPTVSAGLSISRHLQEVRGTEYVNSVSISGDSSIRTCGKPQAFEKTPLLKPFSLRLPNQLFLRDPEGKMIP